MRIRTPKDWELRESAVTPESVYRRRDRREFLKTLGLGAAGAMLLRSAARAAEGGFPAAANGAYPGTGLKVTPYELITHYNNFYEFGLDKADPAVNANKGWQPEPWTVEIGGMVRNPGKWDVEDLIRKFGGIEQRVYRHRCVEAWSMVVPWDGFPLSKLVAFVDPQPGAKYLKMTSWMDDQKVPGQQSDDGLDGRYVEGLRVDEATNELAFIATGIYGKAIPNQNGAPLRLVTPWKYGFKGIKCIGRIEFTDRAPVNTWQKLARDEYGFYANVNPKVDHPRWSQASERVIGGGIFSGRQATLMFNGYEPQVASLYQGMDLVRNF
jgi:sulfoxide reductase catalytic subunit YedY